MSNLSFPSGYKFVAVSHHCILSCYQEEFGCDLGNSPFTICRLLDPLWPSLHQYNNITRYLLQMWVPRPRVSSTCACAVIAFISKILTTQREPCECPCLQRAWLKDVSSETSLHTYFFSLCRTGPLVFWVLFFIHFNDQNLPCVVWPDYIN